MKRYISIVAILVVILSLTASCIKAPTLVEEVATAEELTERVGFTMAVPSTAKYATYSIIETTTAEARFSFNSFIFVYRGSKLNADAALHQKEGEAEATSTIEIDDRATVTISSYPDGSRIASWNYNGTNYTLYAQKSVVDDVFSELCDLIIK